MYLLLFIGILVGSESAAAGQGALRLEGIVRDSSGASMADARVDIKGPEGSRSITSDAAGLFRFDGLPAGRYEVTISRTGFSPTTRTVQLDGRVASLDVTLQPSGVRESVTVTAAVAEKPLDLPSESGSRLGLTAREIPATLEIISHERIQELGLRSTLEVLNSVPAVMSTNHPGSPGGTAIRGFAGSAVSLLFDGTRITTSGMVTRVYDSWTFERIEVLKGPASVLYGEGALAGAINYVPKKPDFNRRRGEMLFSYGSFGSPRAAAGVTGPLSDRVAYRLDGAWKQTDGYIDDTAFGSLALNGAIEAKLSRTATATFAVDHFRDDTDVSYWGTPLVPRSIARQPTDVVTDSRGLVVDKTIRNVNYNVADGITDANATWIRTKIDWQIAPAWRLRSDTYYFDADRRWLNSEVYTFSAATNLINRSTVLITQDHQFYGNRTSLAAESRALGFRNRFTGGVEVNRNDFFNPRRFGTTTAVDPFSPARGLFPVDSAVNFPGAGNRVDFTTKIDLLSVFAENAANVTRTLLLVGGIRRDQLTFDRGVQDLNTGQPSSFDRTFGPTTWRVGAVQDLAGKTQAFAQYSYAVAPVATILLISQANARFNLTTGSSWEGGLKGSWMQDRVDLTASVFRIQQDDILTRDETNPAITIQGGSQLVRGTELSASAAVTSQLRIDGNFALLDAEFTKLLEAGGVSRAGNTPPDVPERTANAWVTYRLTGLPLTVSAGLRHRGRLFINNANSGEMKRFTLLDASGSWQLGGGELTLRGRNLTDALYADRTGSGTSQVLLGAPRSVDVTWTTRF